MEKDIWHTVPGLLLPIVIFGNCWQSFSNVGAGLLALLVTWGIGYIWHQGYRVWFESWLGGDGFARKDRQVLKVLLGARQGLASVDDQRYTRKDYWQAFLIWEHVFYTADWPRFVQHNKDQWHYLFAYKTTASAAFASALVCLLLVSNDVARASACVLSVGLFCVSVLFFRKAGQTYRSLNLQEEMAVRQCTHDFGDALGFSRKISLPRKEFWICCPALSRPCRFIIGLLVIFVGVGVGYGAFKLSRYCSGKTSIASLVIQDLREQRPNLTNSL